MLVPVMIVGCTTKEAIQLEINEETNDSNIIEVSSYTKSIIML